MGGQILLFALVCLGLVAPALAGRAVARAEVVPDGPVSYPERRLASADRCDAELDLAPVAAVTTAPAAAANTAPAATAAARERLVCTGDPRIDDPACWAPDPHGVPTSHATSGAHARLRLAVALAPALRGPLARTADLVEAAGLGPRVEHRLGLLEPPRR